MNQKKLIQKLSIIFIIVLVMAIGAFALNQTMAFYYKIQLLGDPCSLCEKIKTPVILNWSNLTIVYP